MRLLAFIDIAIGALSRNAKNSIHVGFFIAVLCVGLLSILYPLCTRLHAIEDKERQTQAKLGTIWQKYKLLPKLKQEVTMLERKYIGCANKNYDFTFTDFLQDVSRAAKTNEFDISNLHPDAQTIDNAAVYSISFTATLDYYNLLTFYKELSALAYPVVLDEFNMQRTDDAGVLLLQAKVVAYKNPAAVPLLYVNVDNVQLKTDLHKYASFEADLSALRDPFSVDFKSSLASNLSDWACNELKFLGYFQIGSQTLGLVEDPLGNTYQVYPGMHICEAQSKIQKVTKAGVFTERAADNIF